MSMWLLKNAVNKLPDALEVFIFSQYCPQSPHTFFLISWVLEQPDDFWIFDTDENNITSVF